MTLLSGLDLVKGPRMGNIVKNNPNASTVGGVTIAASLITWGASELGYQLDQAVAVAIAGAVTTAVLFVGRTGIRGLIRMVWRGKEATG